jgi:hypothetical protein
MIGLHIMARSKGGVNKAQLVRDALAELGDDAKPQAIAEHIKTKAGVEISPLMISSYKSSMKNKKPGKPGKRGRKPGSTKATGGAGVNSAVVIADITTIRALITRHGKTGVLELIDALS